MAFSAGSSAFLNRQRWLWFPLGSTLGSFVGICAGYALWWPKDPIAGTYVYIVVAVTTVMAAVITAVGAFVGSRLSVPRRKLRYTAWIALAATVAFGPVCLVLTPPLVSRRLARNERLAAERMASLQRAVKRTLAESRDPALICAGPLLARNYSGPLFSDEDWRRITGNYVKQDGYFFMIYCKEQNGYVISAGPKRDGQDGKRRFCVDETGETGCGTEWNRSRYACVPCRK